MSHQGLDSMSCPRSFFYCDPAAQWLNTVDWIDNIVYHIMAAVWNQYVDVYRSYRLQRPFS